MRNYASEVEKRVDFIRNTVANAGASGIVYGNSGGKDSALVGILCKMACENTLGVIMPCESKRNFSEDMDHALSISRQFNIDTLTVDLTEMKQLEIKKVSEIISVTDTAATNVAPRLRMITLYLIAQSGNMLVAGTGNRSERYMGYFTKWGDGAHDFNPISDLTVTEIYEFLRYLKAPESIITKAPSAGLFEGQTDEKDMGISYAEIDKYLLEGEVSEQNKAIIDKYHSRSEHKRNPIAAYRNTESISR